MLNVQHLRLGIFNKKNWFYSLLRADDEMVVDFH